MLRGRLLSDIVGENVSVTAFRTERISLVPGGGNPDTTIYGANLIWHHVINESVSSLAEIGYRKEQPADGNTYNLALGAYYRITPTFNGGLRYDYLRRDANQQIVAVNAITFSLRKLF